MTNLPLSDVSRETLADLQRYCDLVEKWNPTINLVSKGSLNDLWNRHIIDSVQIAKLIPDGATSWADFGSGGGFPGLVVAIFAKHNCNQLFVTLVESDLRKASFLRTVIRTLGLNAKVISKRIEAIDPLKADVISARALANFSDLIAYFHQHSGEKTIGIFPKGKKWQDELDAARRDWCFSSEVVPSITESEAVILTVSGVTPCKV